METWLGVELRHLSALAAVAEEQSFRGAADRLGYVQSAVSQRIAQLELAVGVRLVERTRGHRHVALTGAGEALLHHAEQIRAQLNAARADLKAISGDADATTLSIGACGGVATRLLPQAIADLAAKAPNLTIDLHEGQSDREHFEAVEDGQLDAAIAELPLKPGPFEWKELLVDPLVLVVPATSPLAGREGVELADIAAEPIVVDSTWQMFKLVEAELAAAGHELVAPFSVTSNAAVQALVGAELGVAIMPRLAVDPTNAATVAIDLSDLLQPRKLVCYWPANRRRGETLDVFLRAMVAVTVAFGRADARGNRVSAPVELAA